MGKIKFSEKECLLKARKDIYARLKGIKRCGETDFNTMPLYQALWRISQRLKEVKKEATNE